MNGASLPVNHGRIALAGPGGIILSAFVALLAASVSLWHWSGPCGSLFLPHAAVAALAVFLYGPRMAAPAAVLSLGIRLLPALYAGDIGETALSASILSAAEGLQALAAAAILKPKGAPGRPLPDDDPLRLFTAAGTAALILPAAAVIQAALSGTPATMTELFSVWLISCVSLLAALPVAFAAARGQYRSPALPLSCVAVTLLLLAPVLYPVTHPAIVLIALTLPLPALFARLYGHQGSALVIFTVAAAASFAAAYAPGPFTLPGTAQPLLQLYLLALAAAGVLARPAPSRNAPAGQPRAADERHYHGFFHRMNDGVAVFRPNRNNAEDYTVRYLNGRFRDLFGLERTAALPAPGSAIFGSSPPPFFKLVREVCEAGIPEETSYCVPRGRGIIHLSAFPLGRRDVAVMTVDVTDLLTAEESLIRSEERLKLALSAARMGIWEYDTATDLIILSDNIEELLGLRPTLFKGTYRSFIDIVHEDDRDLVQKTFARALADMSGSVFFLEYRLKEDGESYRWIESQGKVIRDGGPVKIMGTLTDVTWEKKSQEFLRLSEKKFQQIFSEAPIAISLTMMDGKFIETNTAFRTLTGYTQRDIKELTYNDLTHPDDLDRELPYYHRCLRGEIKNYTIEKRYITKSGNTLWVNMTAAVIEDDSSLPVYVLGMAVDVTEQKSQEERIRSSLEEKNLLLKEIHHRVKNNMQIISSILNLQTHHISDESAMGPFIDCQNRVHSMALVHEKLYQSSDMAKINFGDYIRDLTKHLSRTFGHGPERIDTVITTDEIHLGIDTAIPTALIINELISNAMKYAFRGKEAGTITIGMTRREGAGHRIVISDDGVGLPEHIDFNTAGTLGLQLVNALTGQLKGSISVDRVGGTAFTIIF